MIFAVSIAKIGLQLGLVLAALVLVVHLMDPGLHEGQSVLDRIYHNA
jgi:hypothetical protein